MLQSINGAAEENVIVFDNLNRLADIIGDLETIKAKQPGVFLSTSAPGSLPSFESVNDIFETGTRAGKSFKKNFA